MNTLSKTLIGAVAILSAIIVAQLFLFSAKKEDPMSDNLFQKHFNTNYKVYALTLPEEIDFAGEPVPLHILDVRERLDRELLVNTYWQSQTLLFHKRANRYFPIIEPILEKHNIPNDFKYLSLIESGFQNVVSPAGATGFWQFMKDTGIEYGLEISNEVDERYHLEKSTEAACRYLKRAYDRYGSWAMAAASYNLGMNGIHRQMERQNASNYYDLLLVEETGRYVFRILAMKEIFSDPRKYGFHFRESDLYPPIETYTVVVDSSVMDFASFAFAHDINYKILKIFNPWLRDTYLRNPSGKRYEISIPAHPELAGYSMIETETDLPDSLVNDSIKN